MAIKIIFTADGRIKNNAIYLSFPGFPTIQKKLLIAVLKAVIPTFNITATIENKYKSKEKIKVGSGRNRISLKKKEKSKPSSSLGKWFPASKEHPFRSQNKIKSAD